MFRLISAAGIVAVLATTVLSFPLSAQAEAYPKVGRPATPREIAAWDIDVRPDFKGLPRGAGTVSQGQDVWDAKCASCHGSFGELNEVFTPIVGGTTKEDVKTGRVAALSGNKQPQGTTMMTVATISTLWDYLNRAMPWTAPKSLSADEVYAVVAYILYLSDMVPEDYTLSDKNIAEAQKLMPNRHGMTLSHGMRDVGGKPDVTSKACMTDCTKEVTIRSTLPDVARPAHGNLQLQNRHFGAVRGADTLKPALTTPLADTRRNDLTVAVAQVSPSAKDAPGAAGSAQSPAALAKQQACLSCHGIANKVIGPAFTEVAARYRGKAGSGPQLAERIRKGTSGNWGSTPMPAQAQLSDDQLNQLVTWILNGAP